jgi:hypothetical protein
MLDLTSGKWLSLRDSGQERDLDWVRGRDYLHQRITLQLAQPLPLLPRPVNSAPHVADQFEAMGSGWEVALSIATTVSQVVMTLSVVPDLYSVHKAKSTGELVVFPLVAMIVNNNCW